jgi:predicted ArsR family transcriptional regulator
MGHLIDQSKRTYSNTLTNWLLRAYKGGPLTRSTIKGGTKTIKRVSVNLLTGVPPDVLAKKTNKDDWRSGFLPRFTFWAATRERYVAQPIRDEEREEYFADWLFRVCWNSKPRAIFSPQAVDKINQWFYDEIEARRSEYPDDIFSLLRRFQDHVILYAALLTVSYESDTLRDMLEVQSAEVERAIQIGTHLKNSVISIFETVTADIEAHIEDEILQYIRENPHCSLRPISKAIGLSMSRTSTLLQKITNEYNNITVNWVSLGKGHPTKMYSLTDAGLEDIALSHFQKIKESILGYLALHPGSTISEIASGIKRGRKVTKEQLDVIMQENGIIVCTHETTSERGRPKKVYSVNTVKTQVDA